MRKLRNILLCAMLLLSGCSSAKADEEAKQTAYAGYYKAIQDTAKFQGSSLYYTISCEMSQLPDSTYRYYVIVDNAQIAMYDVIVMAVEDNTAYEDAGKMMPSIGIFDDTEYSMIPNQINSEKGFVKGMTISGECAQDSVLLKIMVEWKDKTMKNTSREFLSFELTMDGFTHPEDTAVNGIGTAQ